MSRITYVSFACQQRCWFVIIRNTGDTVQDSVIAGKLSKLVKSKASYWYWFGFPVRETRCAMRILFYHFWKIKYSKIKDGEEHFFVYKSVESIIKQKNRHSDICKGKGYISTNLTYKQKRPKNSFTYSTFSAKFDMTHSHCSLPNKLDQIPPHLYQPMLLKWTQENTPPYQCSQLMNRPTRLQLLSIVILYLEWYMHAHKEKKKLIVSENYVRNAESLITKGHSSITHNQTVLPGYANH